MTKLLSYVLAMAILTWLLILVASLIRARAWTPQGLMAAFGNRENLAPATVFAGRAVRTADNTLENFVLFAAVALLAHASGNDNERSTLGAEIFFWARVAYVPIYYAGLPFVRTGVWAVAIVGLGLIVSTLL